jgi:ABC-type phosphate/phosphonate transport system substrate-binding protein
MTLAAAQLTRADEQGFGDGMLVCYPNAPGTARNAAPVMERLGSYLTTNMGQRFEPAFFNAADPAREWTEQAKPRFAILSQALYLRWREELGLEVVALSERDGAIEDRFHLLVRGDSPWTSLEDFSAEIVGRKPVVWSSHLEDPRFAARVVFRGQLTIEGPAGVQVLETQQPLRALRRLKSGKAFEGQPVDAVLVDDSIWQALQQLKTFQGGVVRPLYSSPSLPTPPVVAMRGVREPDKTRLRDVLVAMTKDPAASDLLETLQVTGFRSPGPDVFDEAVAAYEGEEGS